MGNVNVKIIGREFNLNTEEKPEYVESLAKFLDKRINNMIEDKVAIGLMDNLILLALDELDEKFKLTVSLEKEQNQKNNVKAENDKLKEQIAELIKENQRLEEKIKDIQDK